MVFNLWILILKISTALQQCGVGLRQVTDE
jgi:hypothetical protein